MRKSDEDPGDAHFAGGCRCEISRTVLLWWGLLYALVFTIGFTFRFTTQMEQLALRGTLRTPLVRPSSSVVEVNIFPRSKELDSLVSTDAQTRQSLETEEEDDETENTSHSSRHSSSNPAAATDDPVKVLCWSDKPFGRAMNQYLQLATLLHQAALNGKRTVVALQHPSYRNFFLEWFDPRDDILLDYKGRCHAKYDAKTLFYMYYPNGWHDVAEQFQTLIPKASIRAEAAAALQEYRGPDQRLVTTVHRRDLERQCATRAQQRKNSTACPSATQEIPVSDLLNACRIDYPMIRTATQGTQVVLFTDGQVPRLDRTFPIRSNHSFPVQAWMMATSDVHYGNPFSTCDTVVYYWRMGLEARGTMHPAACYAPHMVSS